MYLVSVILLIREGEEYMKYLDSHFSAIEKNYKNILKFEYFSYENDSRDKTIKELKLFYANRSGKYFCETVPNSKIMSGISMDRGTTMAKLRNKLKKYHGRLKSDFVLFLNCDTVFLPSSIMAMINSLLTSSNTSMVTGYPICYGSYVDENETNHYYDSLALISENDINYIKTGNSCIFNKCTRCKIYRNINNINIPENELLQPKSVVKVKSAFGGFALIKTSIYNIVEWGESVCEHHSFCENVQKFGNIILDPSIKFFTTNKKYSLKYKIIQRILKNLVENNKLAEKSKNDYLEHSSDEYSSDEDEAEPEDESENLYKKSEIDESIHNDDLVETNKDEEKTIVISNSFENDADDPLLKKSNVEKTKVVIKNSLFDQLYNINRFGENDQQEPEIKETILPVEEETLILIEELDLNMDIESEVIIKKEEKVASINVTDLLDFFENKSTTNNFVESFEFPVIHLKAPETLKIIPNLYEEVIQTP